MRSQAISPKATFFGGLPEAKNPSTGNPGFEAIPQHQSYTSATKCLKIDLCQRKCRCLASQLKLDKLEYFLSNDDIIYLKTVALDNKTYHPLLERLKKEGIYGELYKDKQTCNTLYWGLKNGVLTQSQFLENYHLLSLSILLKTNHFGGEKPLSTSFQLIDADNPEQQPKWDNLDRSIYKFQLSRELQIKIKDPKRPNNRFNDMSNEYELCVEHLGFFIVVMSDASSGIKLTDSLLELTSLTTAVKQIHGDDPVLAVPGFGYGDGEKFKCVRKEDEHPLALWHFNLNSLIQPDGLWFGSLAYLHDVYHVKLLNRFTRDIRQDGLMFDDTCIQPVIEFSKRQIQCGTGQQQSDEDALFIAGYSEIIKRVQNVWPTKWNLSLSYAYPWGMNFQDTIKYMTEIPSFVDQEFKNQKKFEDEIQCRIKKNATMEYYEKYGVLKQNHNIFHMLFTRQYTALHKVFGVKAEKSADIQTKMKQCSIPTFNEIEWHCGINSGPDKISTKWHVDFWLNWLETYPQTSPTPK